MWGAESGVHGEGLVVWGAQRGVCGMGHQAVVGRDMPHRTRCTGCCTRCQAAGVGYATGATLCRPPGFRRSGGGVGAARHAAGQAVLLDGAHLALSPQAMVGARAGYTGFPCSLRPFCSSHPRSQPVASQPEEHPRILLLQCCGVSSWPGSASPLLLFHLKLAQLSPVPDSTGTSCNPSWTSSASLQMLQSPYLPSLLSTGPHPHALADL